MDELFRNLLFDALRVQRRSPEEASAGTGSLGLREDRPMSLRPAPT
jgi:hypothetical protein